MKPIALFCAFCAIITTSLRAEDDPILLHQKRMHTAVQRNDVATMKILLRTPYVRADDILPGGYTWLHDTCGAPSLEAAKVLFDNGYDVFYIATIAPSKGSGGKEVRVSSLMCASNSNGQTQILKLFLDTMVAKAPMGKNDPKIKAQVDFIGGRTMLGGKTPVITAVVYNARSDRQCADSVSLLLDAGANPNPPIFPHGTGADFSPLRTARELKRFPMCAAVIDGRGGR